MAVDGTGQEVATCSDSKFLHSNVARITSR